MTLSRAPDPALTSIKSKDICFGSPASYPLTGDTRNVIGGRHGWWMAVSQSMFSVQYLTTGDEGHGDHPQAAVDALSDELSSPSQMAVESPVAEKAQLQ